MENSTKYTPKGEDVIRNEVTERFKNLGYDPSLEANKPLLDDMIKRELDVEAEREKHHKTVSKAIQQKKKYREKVNELANTDEDDEEENENGEPKPKGEPNTQTQQVDTSNLVSRDELQATLHRQKYPNLTDEEYNSINALAKANSKSFEDTVANNPMAKSYFDNSEARERLSGATTPPSTRSSANHNKSEEEKIADELDTDLPPGFSS